MLVRAAILCVRSEGSVSKDWNESCLTSKMLRILFVKNCQRGEGCCSYDWENGYVVRGLELRDDRMAVDSQKSGDNSLELHPLQLRSRPQPYALVNSKSNTLTRIMVGGGPVV